MPTSCMILDKLRTFALLPFPVCEMEILVLLRGIQGIKDFKECPVPMGIIPKLSPLTL